MPINPAARTGNRTKSRPLSGARLNKVLILGISLLFLAVIVLLVVDRVAVQSFVTGVATSIRAMYDTPQTEVVPPLETPGETESDSGSSSRVMEQPSTEIVRDATQSSSAESAPRAAEYWIALVYEAWAASELDLALYYLEQGLRDDPDNRQLQALAKAVRADLKTGSP